MKLGETVESGFGEGDFGRRERSCEALVGSRVTIIDESEHETQHTHKGKERATNSGKINNKAGEGFR